MTNETKHTRNPWFLSAAAPEMYKALEKIMEIELSMAQEYSVNAEDSEIYCIAEKALKQARGEYEEEETV